MKYKYIGQDERVFPSLGITVKQGDEFDAPDNFKVHNVIPSNNAKIIAKPTNTKQESE